MPCQSYDSSWDDGSDARKIRELKKQADKLARIACKALTELEKSGIEDLLLLKDDEVRTWWLKHKEDDAREQARVAEIERKERVKAEALARLSSEEKELLGLEKPKKNSGKAVVVEDDYDEEAEEEYNEWEAEIEAEEMREAEIEAEEMISEFHKLIDGTIVKTYKIR
jgi:hypothetical protein